MKDLLLVLAISSLTLVPETNAQSPHGLPFTIFETPCWTGCDFREREATAWCPDDKPYVCGLQVGTHKEGGEDAGVSQLWIRCCGLTKEDSVELLVGGYSPGDITKVWGWSTTETYYIGVKSQFEDDDGFGEQAGLLDVHGLSPSLEEGGPVVEHENGPVYTGDSDYKWTSNTCPNDHPYLCGARFRWETGPEFGDDYGGISVEGKCCKVASGYQCTSSSQCASGENDSTCVEGVCECDGPWGGPDCSVRLCPCRENNRWFECPPDFNEDTCYLTSVEPSLCSAGPMETVIAEYETEVLNALQPFQLAGASTTHLQFYTAVGAISRQLYCVGQPYLGAETESSVTLLGNSLNKLALQLDAANVKANLVDQTDGTVSSLVALLNRVLTRKLQANALYEDAPIVPAYSLERILKLVETNPQAGFSVEDTWRERKRSLKDQILKGTSDANAFKIYCTNLFSGLQADTATEQAIQLKNLQELDQSVQDLFESVNFSKDLFGDLESTVAGSARELNRAVDTMQRKIEEFNEAKLKANLFDAIVQVVVAVGTLVAAAAATFFTAGAFAPSLAGAAVFLLDSIEPLMDVADGVETIIDAAGGVDDAEILQIDDFDIGVDAKSFVSDNNKFRENAEAVSKELFALGKNLENVLAKAVSDPIAFQSAKIKGNTMNPQVWDLINLQLLGSLQAMRICERPEISKDRRRLIQREQMESGLSTSELSEMEIRRLGYTGAGFGRSLESKGAKAERLYNEAKDAINVMTSKCELFKIEWQKLTTAGKMLHTDIASMVSLFRDIRVTAFAASAYKQNAENWATRQSDGCSSLDENAYAALLESQLRYAHVMEAEELYSAQRRLWDTCETVQYVLNPDNPPCNPAQVFHLANIHEVEQAWEEMKTKFNDDWQEAITFKDANYRKVDITNFVDLESLRKWDDANTAPVLEFELTPEMLKDIDTVDVRCSYNVEVLEAAVVFQGTNENALYGTTVQMLGPFVKETKDSTPKVFIPTNRYKLAFKYKVGDSEGSCDTSATEFTKLCGKQLCAESGGSNLELKDSGNIPLPSLYSRYRIDVESFGQKTLFKDVNGVHLLFRGRWKKKDGVCNTPQLECSWNSGPSLAVIIGSSVAGAAVAMGAGVAIWKLSSKGPAVATPMALEVSPAAGDKPEVVVDDAENPSADNPSAAVATEEL